MSDERLPADEIMMEMQRTHLILPFLLGLKLEELRREFEINDTIGPLFDPTGWMRNRKAVERNQEIVRVLVTAQRAIRKVVPDYDSWKAKQEEMEDATT